MNSSEIKIDSNEVVARYVFFSRKKKPCRLDGTVKRHIFTPPKNLRCSVTRHNDYSIQEIWDVGFSVARKRDKTLIGKADVSVSSIRKIGLNVMTELLDDDRNHANILGWPNPDSFHERANLAQELAYASTYEALSV